MARPRAIDTDQAAEIRRIYTAKSGYSAGMRVLAQRFGVSIAVIHRVLTGEHPSAAGLPNVSAQRRTLTVDWSRPALPSTQAKVRHLGPATAAVIAASPKRRPCPQCGAGPDEPCIQVRFTQYPKPIASFHRSRRVPVTP